MQEKAGSWFHGFLIESNGGGAGAGVLI